MNKKKVMFRAADLGVTVDQRKCPLTGEWEVDLICGEGLSFSSHGLSVLSVWTGQEAPDWKYIYNELEDAEVTQCQE